MRLASSVVLLLLALPVRAADLCTGPCSVSMEFASGGSISTGGATITFGPGGSLSLGAGGSIALGEGGSITPAPAEGQAPDFSGGGSIVLGPGGGISFGDGGALASGEQGGISVPDGGAFEVTSARAVTIDSAQAVRVGDLRSHGAIDVVTTDGDVLFEEAGPFTFTMPADDTESIFTIDAVDDVVLGMLGGAPNLSVTAMNADMVSLWVEATLPSGEPIEPAFTCGGPSAGTINISTGTPPPADYTPCFTMIDLASMPLVPTEVASPLGGDGGGAGGLGMLTLIGLGLAALRRLRNG